MANIATVQITHKCGHVFGHFSSQDDHGSFEIMCPKCKVWAEIHMNFFLNVDEEHRVWMTEDTTYEDVSHLYPEN